MNKRKRDFLASYGARITVFAAAVNEARIFVEEALALLPVPVHAISARAKTLTSIRGKLRRKDYSNPFAQLTDLIGLRVITYFATDVDKVVTQLRGRLEISEAKSRDIRVEMDADRFGYRSVHLICRLRPAPSVEARFGRLKRRWFEIQVRSILDHAWAEIEHEMVYKAGIDFPKTTRRRFMAVAGSLEVLEHAFAWLTQERDHLIDSYKTEYGAGSGLDLKLDVARLLAFLEVTRPQGLSWRSAEQLGVPFASGMANSIVDALHVSGINTPRKLASVMATESFANAVAAFAAGESLATSRVSHLALAVLAIASKRPQLLRTEFPDFVTSPSLATAVSLLSL